MRYDSGTNWFEMWNSDKKDMIAVMYSNMNSDLDCGYNPLGKSITAQRKMIDAYISDYQKTLDSFVEMTDEKVNRWCFFDMIKRGVIE